MDEAEYQAGLAQLRAEWGRLSVDPDRPGVLRAALDPTTGVLVGIRAPLFAEIVNRALAGADLRQWAEHDALCPAFADPRLKADQCECGLTEALRG